MSVIVSWRTVVYSNMDKHVLKKVGCLSSMEELSEGTHQLVKYYFYDRQKDRPRSLEDEGGNNLQGTLHRIEIVLQSWGQPRGSVYDSIRVRAVVTRTGLVQNIIARWHHVSVCIVGICQSIDTGRSLYLPLSYLSPPDCTPRASRRSVVTWPLWSETLINTGYRERDGRITKPKEGRRVFGDNEGWSGGEARWMQGGICISGCSPGSRLVAYFISLTAREPPVKGE